MQRTNALSTLSPGAVLPVLRMLGVGFLFWLAFLLSLEPDNILRALRAGSGLDWSQETIRILGASLLGCAATPVLLEQVRRFPIEGAHWRRNAVLQGLGSILIAAVLIAVSCVLAKWVLVSGQRPLGRALREEMAGNGPLVAFCVVAFVGLAHAARFFEQARARQAQPIEQSPRGLTSITVRERGQVTLLDLASIDWIETQGNYLALHAGSSVHLIRDSLARLEARLDPAQFLRVHRRFLVAADRIETIASLGAGDGQLRLKDGTELRLSRTYRDRIEIFLAMR
jgi:two-component system, LytTR family, response regulator